MGERKYKILDFVARNNVFYYTTVSFYKGNHKGLPLHRPLKIIPNYRFTPNFAE
jgi:hypothetical protein